jgi:hypothetical protein
MNADFPTYHESMLPLVRASHDLGGSGTGREITEVVVESQGFSEDGVAVTYEGRNKSIFLDRIDWARTVFKLGRGSRKP